MQAMAQTSRSMESRVGRDKQRYGNSGERLVAGIVPLSTDKYYVLLIKSTGGKGWVLPKGGWETDEATAQDAATREAWEEAGIVVSVKYDLGVCKQADSASGASSSKKGQGAKATYHFFEATVERLEAQWPEMHKRTRTWMTFSQAEEALAGRPELLDALKKCTMQRC